MAWRVWGEGPPLVLLHGGQGSWAHWFRNIEALGTTRTLWVADLPGSGDSALPDGSDHAAYVAPIAAGMRQLIGPDPVEVMGFSFGGILATHLAANHPGAVKRLVVIDPGGLDTPLGDFKLRSVRDLAGAAWDEAVRSNMLSLMLHDPATADELAFTIYRTGMLQARMTPNALVLPDHLLRALARTEVPLDAIWGALDAAHPEPGLQEAALRAYRPAMQFRVVPDAGHWCMFENAPAFNAIALDLLDRP